MPEVSRFFGVSIRMYFDDHHPPHFHAIYGDAEAVFGIEPLALLRGRFPRRAVGMVMEWAATHQRELVADWQLMSDDQLRIGATTMFPRVCDVRYVKDYTLEITFSDGTVAELDFRHRVVGRGGVFVPMEELEFFRQVTVDREVVRGVGRTESTSVRTYCTRRPPVR